MTENSLSRIAFIVHGTKLMYVFPNPHLMSHTLQAFSFAPSLNRRDITTVVHWA